MEGGTYGKQTYRVCCKVAALLERYGRGAHMGNRRTEFVVKWLRYCKGMEGGAHMGNRRTEFVVM